MVSKFRHHLCITSTKKSGTYELLSGRTSSQTKEVKTERTSGGNKKTKHGFSIFSAIVESSAWGNSVGSAQKTSCGGWTTVKWQSALQSFDIVLLKRSQSAIWLRSKLKRIWTQFLKLINYSCGCKPIGEPHFGQVHVSWYPMNIPIKTHSISSKTDQDTDQETWILISLNTKYSSATKQRRKMTNLRKTTHQMPFLKQCILKF